MTLKSLHTYLRLLENASDMKRKMPASSSPRSLKEGFSELSKLVGLDNAVFKDPQNIASVIGPQRFVMIWGEPSLTAHVARIFDSSKLLLTVLIDYRYFDKAPPPQSGAPSASGQPATAANSFPSDQSEGPVENLKSLLSGNLELTCRLFRVLFEHMLAFASPSTAQQGSAVLVNDLVGSKEHGRSFMATAMFVLGAEVDRENLMSFMIEQNLFGIQLFEQLLLNRDYCDAFYTFRRLERAFVASSAEEESQLKRRFDKFTAQFGGKPCSTKMFEADDQHKSTVDSHVAATDLLEVMALTPWGMSLSNSVAAGTSNCLRSLKTVARHFELFAEGKQSKEQADNEIADHLLAFGRQFSADTKTAAAS
jgi:hypothetical protein